MEGSPPGPPPMAMPTMPGPRKTPIGVMILGILTIIFGIATLGFGAFILMGAGILGAAGAGAIGIFVAIIGGMLALFGLLALLSGVGLIRLRPWAWWLTFIIGILSVLGGLGGGQYIIGAVWLIIVIYLIVVKKEFGRPAGM